MKAGDIVSLISVVRKLTGIVIGFDSEGDPYILNSETNSIQREYINRLKILHEQDEV